MSDTQPDTVAIQAERRQPEDGMWDVPDVAAYLKVSEATIRARILNDSIPFHKVGRLVRFRRDEIDAWVESGRSNVDDEKVPA